MAQYRQYGSEEVILTLRGQAFERAVGELSAFLATYWPEWQDAQTNVSGYDEVVKIVNKFIEEMRDHL